MAENIPNLRKETYPGPGSTEFQTRWTQRSEVKWKLFSHVWLFANPMNYTVHGILQARILEWVAFPFSRKSSQPRDQTQVSHVAGRFFTSWVRREAQEYGSGYPIPSPADLPFLESKPWSLHCKWILYHLSYHGSLNPERPTLRHIIIKMAKLNFISKREKQSYTRELFSRNLKARKVWGDIFKDLKGKTLQLSILYLTRISFRI